MHGSNSIFRVKSGELSFRVVIAAMVFVIASFALINLNLALTNSFSTLDIFSSWLIAEGLRDSWGTMVSDSWGFMKEAYSWLRQSQAVTVYQDLFFNRHIKFQYAPTSLIPLHIVEYLGFDLSVHRFYQLNAMFQLVGALATGAASVLTMRRVCGNLDAAHIVAALLFGITVFVTFYPTMWAYYVGQIQVWINVLFCCAAIFWLLDRKLLVGAMIGACCLLKPQFSLFLVWALVRREWEFVAGWAAVSLLGLAVSLYLFGFANHWDYLSVLQYLSQRGEAYYPNQSINGLLNRFFGNGLSWHFYQHAFPPYNLAVYIGTFATSIAMLAFVLFYKPKNGFIDFLIAGLGFTMASPIAWEHHYGILPIYFVTIFFVILSLPVEIPRRPLLIVLALAFVVGGNFYAVVNSVGPGFASLVQSYLFFSAVAIFWLLYRLRDHVSWDKSTLPARTTATGRLSP